MKNALHAWKKIAGTVATLEIRFFLSLFYWILITPVGLLYQLATRKKLLQGQSVWHKTTIQVDTIAQARQLR